MLLDDLLSPQQPEIGNIRDILTNECSQFLSESLNIPLLRSLPCQYNNIQKVKARVNKHKSQVGEIFEMAFNENSLLQKAIFAYPSIQFLDEMHEPFYVFPINGYKFMYCTEIHDSKQEYQDTINTLLDTTKSEDSTKTIMSGVLQYSYSNKCLLEAISSNAEIIFYNIPYYYAVRASIYNYNQLLGE